MPPVTDHGSGLPNNRPPTLRAPKPAAVTRAPKKSRIEIADRVPGVVTDPDMLSALMAVLSVAAPPRATEPETWAKVKDFTAPVAAKEPNICAVGAENKASPPLIRT